MPEARHATGADLDALTDTLANAFSDDPMMHWMYDDVEERPALLKTWMRFSLDAGLTRGHVYAAGDNHAAAIWSPPDVTLFDELWGKRMGEMLQEQLGERMTEVTEGLMAAMGHHPEEPHFYLFILGTHGTHQSLGLGQHAIDPVLRVCDRQGLTAHLESSNVRNVPFYERHGFEVVAEVQLPQDGPIIRPMTRRPR